MFSLLFPMHRRVDEEELANIAEIVEKIDAKKECTKRFLKEYGYVPYKD